MKEYLKSSISGGYQKPSLTPVKVILSSPILAGSWAEVGAGKTIVSKESVNNLGGF